MPATVVQGPYDHLIQQIYAAGLHRKSWKDVLAGISDAVGHVCLALNAHDSRANANVGFLTHNYDPAFEESYRRYYAGINPWNGQVSRQPVGRAVRSQHVLGPEQLRTTEFYNDWIVPQEDVGTGAGLTLFRSRDRFVRLSANIRFRDQESMQEPLVTLLDRLVPHMSAAIDLARAMPEPVRAGLEIVIGKSTDGVFVLDGRGRTCLMNQVARTMQSRDAPIALDAAGFLRTTDERAGAALAGWLRRHQLGVVVPLRELPLRDADGSVIATIAGYPLASEDNDLAVPLLALKSSAPALMLVVRLADRSRYELSDLSVRRHRLTAAEEALVGQLMNGHSPAAIAASRGTAVSTVRSQIKSIMSKTGTRRIAELVSLLLREELYPKSEDREQGGR